MTGIMFVLAYLLIGTLMAIAHDRIPILRAWVYELAMKFCKKHPDAVKELELQTDGDPMEIVYKTVKTELYVFMVIIWPRFLYLLIVGFVQGLIKALKNRRDEK